MELDLSKRRASLSGDGGKLVTAADERVLRFMEGVGGGGEVKSRAEDMLE